jgi:hypothetical protein
LCYPEEDSKTVLSEVKQYFAYKVVRALTGGVQAESARIVAGGTRLISISKLYAETGWEYLKDRRENIA